MRTYIWRRLEVKRLFNFTIWAKNYYFESIICEYKCRENDWLIFFFRKLISLQKNHKKSSMNSLLKYPKFNSHHSQFTLQKIDTKEIHLQIIRWFQNVSLHRQSKSSYSLKLHSNIFNKLLIVESAELLRSVLHENLRFERWNVATVKTVEWMKLFCKFCSEKINNQFTISKLEDPSRA